MATPSDKLAESLEVLRKLQEDGLVAIRSRELTRTHRERLVQNGFLQEVIKGWYIPARPGSPAGESTAWYSSFWAFCAGYLAERFGKAWSLAPEQSLLLHVGNRTVPRQLTVHASKPSNNVTQLPHNTSLLDIRAKLPTAKEAADIDDLRVFSLPAALVAVTARFFEQNATDARAALAMVRDASELLEILLEGGHSVVAGRLAGGLRNIGRAKVADDIINTMKAAGYKVRETDPFAEQPAVALPAREHSPYVSRIKLMWTAMRETVIEVFPEPPGIPRGKKTFLKQVDQTYTTDAYHSLSIEGYRVNRDLIERVRTGNWNPDGNEDDRGHRNALAARGYWQAFQAVKASIERVLNKENAGQVVDDDHGGWYRELFGPSVTAGIIQPADLAGYRNAPVYIRGSMHTPPPREAVRDLMPALFEALRDEEHAAVRVVLGHFLFVYTHPYMDGNGRIGRFLMNVMLASGGYPWTVIPIERRDDYMAALEQASVYQNIQPFAGLLADLVSGAIRGEKATRAP